MSYLIVIAIIAIVIFVTLYIYLKGEAETTEVYEGSIPLSLNEDAPQHINELGANMRTSMTIGSLTVIKDGRVVIHVGAEASPREYSTVIIEKNIASEYSITLTKENLYKVKRGPGYRSDGFVLAKTITVVSKREFKRRLKSINNENKFSRLLL